MNYSSPVDGEARDKLVSLTSFNFRTLQTLSRFMLKLSLFVSGSETVVLHLNIHKTGPQSTPIFALEAILDIGNSVQFFHLRKIAPLCPRVACMFPPFRNVLYMHLFHKVVHRVPPHNNRMDP